MSTDKMEQSIRAAMSECGLAEPYLITTTFPQVVGETCFITAVAHTRLGEYAVVLNELNDAMFILNEMGSFFFPSDLWVGRIVAGIWSYREPGETDGPSEQPARFCGPLKVRCDRLRLFQSEDLRGEWARRMGDIPKHQVIKGGR